MEKLAIAILWATALGLSCLSGCAQPDATSDKVPEPGYHAAVCWNGSFYAGGTDGRLDRITLSGDNQTLPLDTTAALTCGYADTQGILFAGEDGVMVFSEDGEQFSLVDTGTEETINGITAINGSYLAVTEQGTVLQSKDRRHWENSDTSVRNDLIAVASTGQTAMAVSAESDILLTHDGNTWENSNFNEVYEGLYPEYVFTSVTALGNSFFILGYTAEEPHTPLLMFSEAGDVWMRKDLAAINNEDPEQFYPMEPRQISSDIDQLLVLCDGGRLLTVPNCVTCNQLMTLSENEFYALALGPEKILVAGADFAFEVLDIQDVRQERIQAEQAAQDLQSGAVLIDVREDEELEADGYIEGSLHIPLDQLETLLPQMVPDQSTELIFYCAMGSRAQQALEQAQQMGYERVYNLGGLSDWPYGIVY